MLKRTSPAPSVVPVSLLTAFAVGFTLLAPQSGCASEHAERAEVVNLEGRSEASDTPAGDGNEGESAEALEATPGRRDVAPRPIRPTPPPAPADTPIPEDPNNPPFDVELVTTKGPILIHVHPEWAPLGAARFRELVEQGFYTDVAFFRVISGFMAQVGIHGDPAVASRWRDNSIQDDPVLRHNRPGTLSFATRGPHTRTTQFFINLVDNSRLDRMGFSPFAEVDAASMATVRQLYSGYGEGAPRGRGPDQMRMQREGNTYLRQEFPELDYIRSARVVP